MKKISIIVPVYNALEYLERILICLINQTIKNLEIILVDDGSTDGSSLLCDKYQEKDKRIKVIHQKNSGVSVARNVGLSNATGDYIGFIDSDDYISLDMFEILYNNLINTKSDISICNYQTFTNELPNFSKNNNLITEFNSLEALKDIITDGKITNFLWNKLFKRELFNGITFPVGKIYEDMYVLPRIFEKIKKVCYTEASLYGYYQRANSYVNTYTIDKNNNYLDFINDIYNYLKKYSELNQSLEEYYCFGVYSACLQAAKSHRLEIIKSSRIKEVLKVYKKKFTISKKMTLKRKLLYYLLYVNKELFYYIVILIK